MTSVSTLEVGSVFNSFAEFMKVFRATVGNNVFNLKRGCRIDHKNKSIKHIENYYPERWEYTSVQLCCKHFGTYESKSKGIRSVGTYKCGCQAQVKLTANKKKGGLVVNGMCLTHTGHEEASIGEVWKQNMKHKRKRRRVQSPSSGSDSHTYLGISGDDQVFSSSHLENKSETDVKVEINSEEESVFQRLASSSVDFEQLNSSENVIETKPSVCLPDIIDMPSLESGSPASNLFKPMSKENKMDVAAILDQIEERTNANANASSDVIKRLTDTIEAESDDNIFHFISKRFSSFSKSTQDWLEDEALKLFTEAKRRERINTVSLDQSSPGECNASVS